MWLGRFWYLKLSWSHSIAARSRYLLGRAEDINYTTRSGIGSFSSSLTMRIMVPNKVGFHVDQFPSYRGLIRALAGPGQSTSHYLPSTVDKNTSPRRSSCLAGRFLTTATPSRRLPARQAPQIPYRSQGLTPSWSLNPKDRPGLQALHGISISAVPFILLMTSASSCLGSHICWFITPKASFLQLLVLGPHTRRFLTLLLQDRGPHAIQTLLVFRH